MKILLTSVLLSFCCLQGANAFKVYKCATEKPSYSSLDLISVQDCDDPETAFEDPVPKHIRILQTDHETLIHAFQCIVTYSQSVTTCGFDSLTYGTTVTVYEKTVNVNPAECQQASDKGTIRVLGRLFQIKINKPMTEIYFSQGNVNADGVCETASFISGGKAFTGAYESTAVRIQLKKIRAFRDSSNGMVSFPDGLTVPYATGFIYDHIDGTIVWTPVKASCKESVSQIYRGKAFLHKKRPGDKRGGLNALDNAIVLVESQLTGQVAGIVTKTTVEICDLPCFSTQIKGVAVCFIGKYDPPMPDYAFKDYFDQDIARMASGSAHHHLKTNLEMFDRFESVQEDICENNRKISYTKLNSLSGGNMVALNDLVGPGHRVFLQGALAYIERCDPIEVTITAQATCSQEIPVTINGTLMFANPLTYVLQEMATVIPCSSKTPVGWKIAGKWICSFPELNSCKHVPAKMNVTTTDLHLAMDFTEEYFYSLYSEEEDEKHRDYVRSATSRGAVMNTVTNQVSFHSKGGIEGSLLRAVDLNKIQDKLLGAWFDNWTMISQVYMGWCALSLVVVFVIVFFSVLCLFVRQWKAYGFGCWIINFFLTYVIVIVKIPMLMFIAHYHYIMRASEEALSAPAEQHEAPPSASQMPFGYLPPRYTQEETTLAVRTHEDSFPPSFNEAMYGTNGSRF
jgi:hypothetical protein